MNNLWLSAISFREQKDDEEMGLCSFRVNDMREEKKQWTRRKNMIISPLRAWL